MNKIKNLLFVALITFFGFNSYALEKKGAANYDTDTTNIASKEKKYHTKIILTNGQKLRAKIISVGDSTIQLDNVVYKNSQGIDAVSTNSFVSNEIFYADIKNIKIRSTIGESVAGFFVGAVVGVIVGGLISLTFVNWNDELSDVLALAALSGAVGGVIIAPIGAIDSPFSIHMEIAGEYSKYEEFKYRMEKKMNK